MPIVIQPNGMFGFFSSISDDFTAINYTPQEMIDYLTEYKCCHVEAVDYVQKAGDKAKERFADALEDIVATIQPKKRYNEVKKITALTGEALEQWRKKNLYPEGK